MHLTPEQIERQPFKMGRRGYDIQQVRDFLREIAAEMRARQEVRERLAETGEESAVAEDRAHSIIAEAQATADQIVADAQANAQKGEIGQHFQDFGHGHCADGGCGGHTMPLDDQIDLQRLPAEMGAGGKIADAE